MWSNNTTFNRPMSRHTFRLRDLDHIFLTRKEAVHLYQVYIIFRPSTDLPDTGLRVGDSNTYTLRAETMQLMIRTTPRVRHFFHRAFG